MADVLVPFVLRLFRFKWHLHCSEKCSRHLENLKRAINCLVPLDCAKMFCPSGLTRLLTGLRRWGYFVRSLAWDTSLIRTGPLSFTSRSSDTCDYDLENFGTVNCGKCGSASFPLVRWSLIVPAGRTTWFTGFFPIEPGYSEDLELTEAFTQIDPHVKGKLWVWTNTSRPGEPRDWEVGERGGGREGKGREGCDGLGKPCLFFSGVYCPVTTILTLLQTKIYDFWYSISV